MRTTNYSKEIQGAPCRLITHGFLFQLLNAFLLVAWLQSRAEAHGCMTIPNPRGSLTTRSPFITKTVDKDAPIDYFPHFPAGPRSNAAGAGLYSQMVNAGPYGWIPFTPLKYGFRWRSSVCGDSKQGPFEHLRGGEYYYGGKIVATYRQGGAIKVELAVNAHHNGFMEMHMCDASKCKNGEINEQCFTAGHCVQLQRAWQDECQTGYSKRCGPIDRNYPGRWYFPCYGFRDGSGKIKRYGSGATILYKLPSHFYCEHCVLQWYWASANTCNPPGVIEYFDGPDRPRGWGRCPGQGGAIGGVARGQRPCGGRRFPEEYLQCADIRILANGGSPKAPRPAPRRPRRRRMGDPKPTPSQQAVSSSPKKPIDSKRREYDEKEAMARGFGAIRDIILLENGVRVESLTNMQRVVVKRGVRLSIEALTERGVKAVTFLVNGHVVFRDDKAPFYIYRTKNRAWRPTLNTWTTITAIADGDTDSVRVYFAAE